MSTVTGAFDDYGVADQVVEDLKNSGIDGTRISIFGAKQRDAQVLRSDVYPTDSVHYLLQSVVLGAAVGIVVALTSVVIAHVGSSWVLGLVAALSGACAGGYIGLMIGAVSRGDIAENDTRFSEASMTKGTIWVGVEAQEPREELKSQKIMAELGAIELQPPLEEEGEKRSRDIFAVGWFCSVVFVTVMFGLTIMSVSYGLVSDGRSLRVVLGVCYIGLLLCSIATGLAGLHTRGAQKWLNMEKKEKEEL